MSKPLASLARLVLLGSLAAASPARPEPTGPRFVVYFQNASARLSPEAFALVRDVAALVRSRRPACIRVVGHADTVGSRSYNRRLSKHRARNTAAALVAASVAPTPVHAAWLGQAAPPVRTGDEVPLPENRAAEILFTACQ